MTKHIVQYCIKKDYAIKPVHDNQGFRLFAGYEMIIEAKTPTCVPLGFAMKFPKEYCGLITAANHRTLGGVIDSDSRGEISVILCVDQKTIIQRGESVGIIYILHIVHPKILFE